MNLVLFVFGYKGFEVWKFWKPFVHGGTQRFGGLHLRSLYMQAKLEVWVTKALNLSIERMPNAGLKRALRKVACTFEASWKHVWSRLVGIEPACILVHVQDIKKNLHSSWEKLHWNTNKFKESFGYAEASSNSWEKLDRNTNKFEGSFNYVEASSVAECKRISKAAVVNTS